MFPGHEITFFFRQLRMSTIICMPTQIRTNIECHSNLIFVPIIGLLFFI